MAKAGEQTTPAAPRAYYSEAVRAEIRRHLEQVFARQRRICNIEWIWDELEITARTYARACSQLEPSPSPREMIAALDGICASIDDLQRRLLELPDQRFVSDFKHLKGAMLIDSGLGSWAKRPLTILHEEVEAAATELRELGRAHAYGTRSDCEADLKRALFRIGEDLLGPKISRTGPLVAFVRLALRPVLSDETPEALYQFAMRERRRPAVLFEDPD
jgi:hypothetical protein